MILVRRRENYYVEIHLDLDLAVFLEDKAHTEFPMPEESATLCINNDIVVAILDKPEYMPQYSKRLMDVEFYKNLTETHPYME